MQNETPMRNRKKPINKRGKQTAPKRKVSKAGKMQTKSGMKSMGTPHQNVPIKSSNQVPHTGFGFGGSVL
jgi:hypothetical protein